MGDPLWTKLVPGFLLLLIVAVQARDLVMQVDEAGDTWARITIRSLDRVHIKKFWYYFEDQGRSSKTSMPVDPLEESATYTLTDLEPNSSYKLHVWYEDAYGRYGSISILGFKTVGPRHYDMATSDDVYDYSGPRYGKDEMMSGVAAATRTIHYSSASFAAGLSIFVFGYLHRILF